MKIIYLLIAFVFNFLPPAFSQSHYYTSVVNSSNRQSDSLALIDFHQKTSGDIWKIKWDVSRPLEEWYGIRVNHFGRVFCIDLDGVPDCKSTKNGGNHLHGTLPDLDLPFLEHLFLASNKLSGEIPDFSALPFLLTLQLSGNRLEGEIPDFGFLENIVKMDLEYNQLHGKIPNYEYLTKLEFLYLGNNFLEGSVPPFGNCLQLKQIYFNDNRLEEELPDFSHLQNLHQLILRNNKLTGELPDFTELSALHLLDLSQNQFYGCLAEDQYPYIDQSNISGNKLLSYCKKDLLILPNAFSPNGDGVNDYFNIRIMKGGGEVCHFLSRTPALKRSTTHMTHFSEYTRENEPFQIAIIIWNAANQLVYQDTDYQGDWDGTYMGKGEVLSPGTYFYRINSNTGIAWTGWLEIKR